MAVSNVVSIPDRVLGFLQVTAFGGQLPQKDVSIPDRVLGFLQVPGSEAPEI